MSEQAQVMRACNQDRDCQVVEGPCGGTTSVARTHSECFSQLERWEMACVDCEPSPSPKSRAICAEGQCSQVIREQPRAG